MIQNNASLNQNTSLEFIPEKEVHTQIFRELNYDYCHISRMGSTCSIFQKLADEMFPEMKVWQQRCLKIYDLKKRADELSQSLIELVSAGIETGLTHEDFILHQ